MAYYPIDLHTHTTASDGTYSPAQLLERAAKRGLQVIGIADHDTLDGLAESQIAGQRLGVEVVPAVELSLRHEYDKDFVGLHLLGYFINPTAPALVDVVARVKQGRIDQKVRQIKKLQELGFDVPLDEVFARASGVPGRPHIAAVLLERHPGRFDSIGQIFQEYLGSQGKAYVRREFALTMSQAVAVIKAAGGVPVFAHPGAYDTGIDPIRAVRNAYAEGIEGVEVFYPYQQGHRAAPNSPGSDWISRIAALADELGLLKTGGTDFHGRANDQVDLGDVGLTEEDFTVFKQGWQRLRKNEK